MEMLFEKVLDDDEKIIKVFKPNKKKLFMSSLLIWGIMCFVSAFVAVIAILFPGEEPADPAWYVVIPICSFILVMAVSILLTHLYYKNLYYAYSNKRIIIRSGIFGVDYKSLDLSVIGAVNVYVSLLDKLVRQNTGTIKFGSPSSPMGNEASMYGFSHIEKPYETCKEIKVYIDSCKTKNAKTSE